MNYFQNLKKKIKQYNKAPYWWGGGIVAVALLDCIDFLSVCVKALLSLADNWPVKFIGSGILLTIQDFLDSNHATIITAYFWLIAIDVATRWLAIGYRYLVDGVADVSQITTVDKIKAIILAFDQRIITSKIMLWGFAGKYMVFLVLIGAAVHADSILGRMGIAIPWPVLKFVLAYIVYNELLSICENLRDAGNGKLDKLVELLNTNLFAKLKK